MSQGVGRAVCWFLFAASMSYSPGRKETHTIGFRPFLAMRGIAELRGVAPGGDVQKSVAGMAGSPAVLIGAEADFM